MILAVAGQKGGTGKTTLAVNVAAESLLRGRSVLLVDADPQASAQTWGAVAAENGYAAPTIVAMGAGLHRPDQLPALAKKFDLAVIDCPPRHGEIQRAALMVADLVVIPCGPQPADVWALAETLDLVKEAQAIRPELRAVIVITRRRRTSLGMGARDAIGDAGLPILETEIGLRSDYEEALGAGKGVTEYARRGLAAEEVRSLVDEVESMLGLRRTRHGSKA